MTAFIVAYIDGHDLKYKTFKTTAGNPDEAVRNLRASYINGDFDHAIISVSEDLETVPENA